MTKSKSWFFEKSSKIDNLLSKNGITSTTGNEVEMYEIIFKDEK